MFAAVAPQTIANAAQYLVNVSTGATHMCGHSQVDTRPAYTLTKSCGTLTAQILAEQIPAEEMQILSFHPGMVYGRPFIEQGIPEDALPFDDREFP